MSYPGSEQMTYKGFYNFCPPWIDQHGTNKTAFFCRMPVKLYGLQYVFCCGNETHRYCCQDPDAYYLHRLGGPEPDMTHLLLLQFWPVLVIIGLAMVFGFVVLFSRGSSQGPPLLMGSY